MEVCHSERQLLNFVMTKIARIDPDIIAGHNILGFDLDVLLHRTVGGDTVGREALLKVHMSHWETTKIVYLKYFF